jgi:hypothetical protein
MDIRKSCETCHWWKKGDVAVTTNQVGNKGLCLWMTTRGGGSYDHATHVPFWAEEITFLTISWQGTSCPVYKQATKRRITYNQRY